MKSFLYVALIAASGLAMAHHSVAQFDTTRLVKIQGTVRQFQWTNPHVWIQLVVTDAAGKNTELAIEGPNPGALSRLGWKSNSLKVGDVITVVVNPLRSGALGGVMQRVVLSDGRVLGQTDVQVKRIEDAKAAGADVE